MALIYVTFNTEGMSRCSKICPELSLQSQKSLCSEERCRPFRSCPSSCLQVLSPSFPFLPLPAFVLPSSLLWSCHQEEVHKSSVHREFHDIPHICCGPHV